MNKFFSVCFISLLAGVHTFAQPANNNCAGATILNNLSNFCSAGGQYTNIGATDDGYGAASCWSGGGINDVWFSFVAIAYDVNITITGNLGGLGTLNQPQFALYSGTCGGTINELACASSPIGQNSVFLYKGGLIIGDTYFIRVDGVNANTGTFRLCINNFTPPPNSGGDCIGASGLCNLSAVTNPQVTGPGNNPNEAAGTCIDIGLGNSESNSAWYTWTCATPGTLTFDITPLTPGDDIDFVLYQLNNDCINKSVIRCNAASCLGIGNLGVTGLNTTAVNTVEMPGCGGAGFGNSPYVSQVNLTAGTSYALLINNFTAANNGFTLAFGGTATFVGPFADFTFTPNAGCILPGTAFNFINISSGAATNNWTFGPAASLPSFNGANPPPITFNAPGTYSVTLEIQSAQGCTVVKTQTITIAAPPSPPVVTTPVSYCMGESATVLSATGASLLWYTVPAGGVGSAIAPIPSTAATGSTLYYVSQTIGSCESPRAVITVNVNALPAVSVNSQTICPGASATLTAAVLPGGGTYLWNPGGATTQSITVSPAVTTNYTCVYTLTGCAGSSTGTVSVSALPLTVSSQTICAGQQATLTATPSILGGTYLWSPGGATTQSITVTPGLTTNYTCTYTLGVCSGSSTGTVTVNVVPIVTIVPKTICAGQSTTLTATPSAGGGTYLWNPGGATTQTVTVSPGVTTNYMCTYTLAGCTSSSWGLVTVNTVPTVSVLPVTICAGQSATLTAIPSTGGGTYSWTPGGATSQSITVGPAASTNYTCTYMLAGCSGSNTALVTVNIVPAVTVASQTICTAQSATLTAMPSPAGGTYSWNPGGATSQSITVSPASTTNYTCSYTLSGCMGSGTGTVTVSPFPTVSVSSQTICQGNSATLTATPSIPGGSWSWSPGGATSQSITVTPASTTTYTATYSITSSCSATNSGTVTVNALPDVSVTSGVICAGQQATLTATSASAGGNWSWLPGGATTSSITVSPANTTTYTAQYTALNGCSNTGTGTVTVNPLPVASVAPKTICNGQTATLTASVSPAGGTFYWVPGGATTPTLTVNPASTQNYTVTYTLTTSCSAIATGTVTVNPVPTVLFNSQTICAGQPATLTALPSLPGGTYSWSPGGGTAASITVHPSATTAYTVIYTLTGCSASYTGMVTVNAVPVVSVTSKIICTGESATLTATPSIPGGTYLWDHAGETTASITVNPPATSIYKCTYSVNNCSGTGTGTVTVNSYPSITLSTPTPTLCQGQSATLTATPSTGGGTYSWIPGGSISQSVSVHPDTTTDYTCTYTLGGCPTAGTVTVTVNFTPVVNFTPKSITGCNPVSVDFIDSSITLFGSVYQWNFGDGSTSSMQNPSHTYTAPGYYPVSLMITTPQGCSSSLVVPETVHDAPLPVAEFTMSNQKVTMLFPVINFSDMSTGAVKWEWNFGDGRGTSQIENPSYSYQDTGTYTVSLIVESVYGCIDTIYGEVHVSDAFTLYIPNAFTPNGDNINDVFTASGKEINNYTMLIFDRWGNVIYRSARIDQSWNGTSSNGKLCQSGEYVYKISAHDLTGKLYQYTGHVALVR
jgi:gliding motility-associated-like protein